MNDKPKPKQSTVRHTRAIQRDRIKRPNTVAPDKTVEARLEAIVHPATLNQVAHFHDLGLRERTLNLPVMMAFVLSLIWRQLGSVAEAVRTLNREGIVNLIHRQGLPLADSTHGRTISGCLGGIWRIKQPCVRPLSCSKPRSVPDAPHGTVGRQGDGGGNKSGHE
jgi:hypothetical protein